MNFKRLMKELSKQKKYLFIGVISLIITIIADLSGPFILKYTLDYKLPELIQDPNEISIILWLGLLYFGVGILNTLFTYIYNIEFAKLGQTVISDLRKRCFVKLQKLPIDYFSKHGDGKIVANITNDTKQIRNLFTNVFSVYLHSVIYITGLVIALYMLEPKLAYVTLAIIPIMMWIQYFRKYANKYNSRSLKLNSKLNTKLNEMIRNIQIIQVFNHENQVKNDFEELNKAYLTYRKKILNLDSLLAANLVDALKRFILFGIIVYFGMKRLDGIYVLSIGTYAVFYDYSMRLMGPIGNIFSNLETFEKANVCTSRVFKFLDTPEEKNGNVKLLNLSGSVKFKNVSFAYEEGTSVLKNINFEVEPGSSVALVGHTGSGKSSLMNLLLRYYNVSDGCILFDGIDINELDKVSLRQHVGIVLQDPMLFHGTIASNIALNNPEITNDHIYETLERIGACSFVDKQPNGLDELIIDGGVNLSFGERQLVAFARAMLYNPKILILDEATANIDTETEMVIQKSLKALTKDRTTFIIAHRLSTIKDVDKIIVLDSGVVAESGSHDDLLALGGIYSEMYYSQVNKIS